VKGGLILDIYVRGVNTFKGKAKIDYEALANIPTLNGIPLVGEQTTESLNIGLPDSEVVKEAVNQWLEDNPSATTTVEDKSISGEKLSPDLLATLDEIISFLEITD
jgi:hypothetical protein